MEAITYIPLWTRKSRGRFGYLSLKTELELIEYASRTEELREVSSNLRYNNAERRHSSLGYMRPVEFKLHQGVQK